MSIKYNKLTHFISIPQFTKFSLLVKRKIISISSFLSETCDNTLLPPDSQWVKDNVHVLSRTDSFTPLGKEASYVGTFTVVLHLHDLNLEHLVFRSCPTSPLPPAPHYVINNVS